MEQTQKDEEPNPSKWRYRSNAVRCVVVFTDASFPEKMVLPEAAQGTTDDVINEIHAKRIILTVFAPEMDCHYKLGAADKSEYHAITCDADTPGARQNALAEYTQNRDNFKKIMEMLAKSVSKSSEVPAL